MADASPPQTVDRHLDRIQLLFEGGLYRQTLDAIATALEQHPYAEPLWLWQAIATDAIGNTEAAIETVLPLTNSQDAEIRKQANYLASIWSAPRLERPQNWNARVENLDRLGDRQEFVRGKAASAPTTPSPSFTEPPRPSANDPKPFPFWRTLIFIGAATLATTILFAALNS
ncbi:hypothetical protein [Synechococcus sp. PCC 7336]|uniref:hypothetical protein n=1 Tax=Synechococcus sp. PCC 7336 TaxID=195250 RepID=UPI000344D6CB|nr:hypothetical protein [Synechococcus sp. PCC 7336]